MDICIRHGTCWNARTTCDTGHERCTMDHRLRATQHKLYVQTYHMFLLAQTKRHTWQKR